MKVELLLPAGNEDSLRAAVNNGADAVYLGLQKFNARRSAGNFNEENISSMIEYCHGHGVKVYVVMNTLVKNNEIEEYFRLLSIISQADAVIIQDQCLVPLIRKNFPGLSIHLSTQATITNSMSIIEDVDRVILPRELSIEEIKEIAEHHEVEIFVHGALCLSYSGQCLFSSVVGGRSGNRGCCAQPCRLKYNNKYLLSTKDLCLLSRIPDLIKAGVSSLKVEGRMRKPYYVATVGRIYRKAIDRYYNGDFKVNDADRQDLLLAFNREFTEGFAFEKNIVDSRMPMNRGIYLGFIKDKKIRLKAELKVGDGIAIWRKNDVNGTIVKDIFKDGRTIKESYPDDIISLGITLNDGDSIYKTSSVDAKVILGDEINKAAPKQKTQKIKLPKIGNIVNKNRLNKNVQDSITNENMPGPERYKIFAKVYNMVSVLEADKAGADIIYYDISNPDFIKVKKQIRHAKLFASTPRIIDYKEIKDILEKIKRFKPDGVLIGDKGVYFKLKSIYKSEKLHLDYSFNVFNDLDIDYYDALPIISPELTLEELKSFRNKNFIVHMHGDIIVMTTKEPIKAPEIIDEDGRHFRVRKSKYNEIMNYKQLGLFNKSKDYLDAGIKYFYIDVVKEPAKFIRIYKKILSGKPFDDKKIRKGYTTGHFDRGIL